MIGLAAIVTPGFVGGIGGTVIGLAAIITPGFVGGIGGTVIGLAAIITPGFVGGIGGTVIGLAAITTLGLVGGIGGTVIGLATARLAMATITATKTKLRTLGELVIYLRSLTTKGRMHGKSNPKVS